MRARDVFQDLPTAISLISRSADELRRFWGENHGLLARVKDAEDLAGRRIEATGDRLLMAYSESAGEEVAFEVRSKGPVNWREDLICPVTHINNRSRVSATLLQRFCGLTPSSSLYVSEQTTPVWKFLKSRYPAAVGSEYLGDRCSRGEEAGGIRNEDLTRLSFASESFQCVASFDCLEHIPDYPAVLGEICRVVRRGGWALLTFPFTGRDETIVRASVMPDGTLVHHLPPEYHGDPVNASQGILCYYHFGFDIVLSLRKAGFEDVFVYWFWSSSTANLGGLQPYVLARK